MPQAYSIISGVDENGNPVQFKALPDGSFLLAGYEGVGQKLLVGTAREKSFWDLSTNDDYDIVQTGAGMTISSPLGGASTGSVPYRTISSGITPGVQTILLSKSSFRAPLEARYQISASQRIANNSFRIGFVEVNEATGAIFTDTSIVTAPTVLNARNAALHEWSGVTATSATLLTRTGGSAIDSLATAFGTGFTTVATGTSPNFIAASGFAISLERDRVNARGFTLNTTANTGLVFAMDRVTPSPSKLYKLAIIVENGASAPASSTDWRIHAINVMDATRFDVSPRNPGSGDLTKAFPVWIGQTLNVQPSSATGLPVLDTSTTYYTDNITNQAASATVTGTSRDAGAAPSRFNKFTAFAFADQPGTMRIEVSDAGTTWRRATADMAVAANTPATLTVPIVNRYYRVIYVNGATPQTAFLLSSAFSAA